MGNDDLVKGAVDKGCESGRGRCAVGALEGRENGGENTGSDPAPHWMGEPRGGGLSVG